MVKRVLVTGKSGQLGRSIHKVAVEYPGLEITLTGREQLDLSNRESIASYFESQQYDVIINTAAYTAVDLAESEPHKAEQINHHAVDQLAEIAKRQGSQLIHISTDYVFDGHNYRPYQESDPVSPLSVYGESKSRGEQALLNRSPQGCIVRTGWLYSEFGNNFVKTMLRLGREKQQISVVDDQVGGPTYATDLARMLLDIVQQEMLVNQMEKYPAIYHYANEGVCSWYDFAKAIFEFAKLDCEITPVHSSQYQMPADRPHYSVLDKSAIKRLAQQPIAHWRASLHTCIQQLISEF